MAAVQPSRCGVCVSNTTDTFVVVFVFSDLLFAANLSKSLSFLGAFSPFIFVVLRPHLSFHAGGLYPIFDLS